MTERLIQDARRHIGHAAQGQYAHIGVTRHDRFGRSGHAHRVAAQRTRHADFGWRLKRGAAHPHIYAFAYGEVVRLSQRVGGFSHLTVIDRAHNGEPRAQPVVVGSHKWIKESHYVDSLEWIYETKRPSILIEEFIKTDHLAPPNDYKIFCFNGKPAFLFVASDRGKNTTKFDFFDLQCNHLPVRNHYPNSNQIIKKPEKFKEMLKYASILSKPFPQVRIDFYYEKGKIYFGEMTFFHFSGNQPFEPGEWDLILGKDLFLSIE